MYISRHVLTIASVCMGTYKTKYLEEEWKVKLDGGQEWKKAKYIGGNLEVCLNDTWVKNGKWTAKLQ